jgi:hypothetical protein
MTLLAFLVARLKEPSSYAGIGMLLAALGVKPSDTMLDAVVQLCVAAAGLIAVMMPEQGQTETRNPGATSRLPPAAVALLIAASLGLGACQAAGGVVSAVTGANQLISTAGAVVGTACAEYSHGKAAAAAIVDRGLIASATVAKLSSIESFGDAACANPPQGDPVSTAVWLGELVGEVRTLVSGKSAANPS